MERLTYRTTKGEAMGNSSVADIGDILGKLADYEDLEEQGLLFRLPVKTGDTIWYVNDDDDNYPIEAKITRIEIKENYILCCAEGKEDCGTIGFDSDDIDKTVFLTKDEARQKLAEMKGVD